MRVTWPVADAVCCFARLLESRRDEQDQLPQEEEDIEEEEEVCMRGLTPSASGP